MKSKGEIRYLINTEIHSDHVTGNFFFPATVIAHQGTRDALSSPPYPDIIIERLKSFAPEELSLMEGYFLKKPSVTFLDRLFLYLGNHTLELIHLPGHTASQIAVYIPKERVVFTGDNIFHNVQTFLHYALPYEWLQSLKKIGELDVDVIVPGHGPVCDKTYLAEQSGFIEEWMEAVKEAIRQGLSKEEARAKISFLDRYPMDMGMADHGPELQRMNVDRLYDVLKGGKG
jgi:glyoxylase-like metal-dependent hydrolase (beta-lactamase superfamily II)